MAGAEHGHVQLVAEREELVAELVDLGDRSLEVALVDLVGRHGSDAADLLAAPRLAAARRALVAHRHHSGREARPLAVSAAGRDLLLHLRDPLERLQVRERLRAAQHRRRAQRRAGTPPARRTGASGARRCRRPAARARPSRRPRAARTCARSAAPRRCRRRRAAGRCRPRARRSRGGGGGASPGAGIACMRSNGCGT